MNESQKFKQDFHKCLIKCGLCQNKVPISKISFSKCTPLNNTNNSVIETVLVCEECRNKYRTPNIRSAVGRFCQRAGQNRPTGLVGRWLHGVYLC